MVAQNGGNVNGKQAIFPSTVGKVLGGKGRHKAVPPAGVGFSGGGLGMGERSEGLAQFVGLLGVVGLGHGL